ncbi:helix-turn-helix domain-containing protein [Anaerorhabdus furcosa]|uniref:TPR repeat-containing protein n=1 Tax=Anaerorhabdus furcosa TaxID=118967 RepID=A0A1T4K2J3_9FIRM|nr:helix-turn-helix transcriptional regulator [Anaerorhabdus furcosa]SJZ36682.1 TPR repeat-containing protein [Anaerorhabdus furcosa]
MENYGVALGVLVKRERLKNNLTAQQLAKKVNFSRSYISRIENGVLVDDSIYKKIMAYFHLPYYGISECQAHENKLDYAYLDFIYIKDKKKNISELLFQLADYKYSPLFAKYMIIQLIYYVTYPEENQQEKETFLAEILSLVHSFSPNHQQIIYDYLGFDFMYSNVSKAKIYFDKAIACGVFNESTSMLYYHISVFQYRCNHLCLAFSFSTKAFNQFSTELNYKRLFYTKFHIANIFMLDQAYDKAIGMYKKLIDNDAVEDKSIVFSNLSWAYYSIKEYDKAKLMISKCTHKRFSYYFNSILINAALKNTSDALSLINEFLKKSNNNIERQIIFILKCKITSQYSDDFEQLLITSYKQAKNSFDITIVSLLNSYLVDYFILNREYKQANYYLRELFNSKL